MPVSIPIHHHDVPSHSMKDVPGSLSCMYSSGAVVSGIGMAGGMILCG